MAMKFLGGFYAIGSQVVDIRSGVSAKRWVTGGSVLLERGGSQCVRYQSDTLVRVDSIHVWGFALIQAVRIGMVWQWPPAFEPETPPCLFIEPGKVLEGAWPLEVTLVMADLCAEELPRICEHEVNPLELEAHFDTGDDQNV